MLVIALAWYFSKSPDIRRKEMFRFTTLIAVAGFLAIVALSEQTALTIEDDILNIWTIMPVVLMISVLMFNMNRQYEIQRELAELKSEQAGLLEHDYTDLNNAYAINAKLYRPKRTESRIKYTQNSLVTQTCKAQTCALYWEICWIMLWKLQSLVFCNFFGRQKPTVGGHSGTMAFFRL